MAYYLSIVRQIGGRVPAWLQEYPITPITWGPELQKLEGPQEYRSDPDFYFIQCNNRNVAVRKRDWKVNFALLT